MLTIQLLDEKVGKTKGFENWLVPFVQSDGRMADAIYLMTVVLRTFSVRLDVKQFQWHIAVTVIYDLLRVIITSLNRNLVVI